MREQVSLFTCGSHGGLEGKYPQHFFSPKHPPRVGSSGALHLDGERWENGEFGALTDSSQHVGALDQPLHKRYTQLLLSQLMTIM